MTDRYALLPSRVHRGCACAAPGHGVSPVRARLVGHSAIALYSDEFILEAGASRQIDRRSPQRVC